MFYFLNIIFLLAYALMYGIFRDGIRSAHKISHKAKFKGLKNYWWFESVREKKRLGGIYHVNKIFTLLFLFASVVIVGTGFLEFMKPVVVVVNAAVGVMLIPMNFYAFIHNNKKEFGEPFVLFSKRKDGTGKFHSSVVDVVWSIVPVLIILFEILYLV